MKLTKQFWWKCFRERFMTNRHVIAMGWKCVGSINWSGFSFFSVMKIGWFCLILTSQIWHCRIWSAHQVLSSFCACYLSESSWQSQLCLLTCRIPEPFSLLWSGWESRRRHAAHWVGITRKHHGLICFLRTCLHRVAVENENKGWSWKVDHSLGGVGHTPK